MKHASMMRQGAWLVLAVLAGMFAGREARAHIVNVGVGTQTWFEVRPRKLVVRFNLGFSSLKSVGEMKIADLDHDGRVSESEEQPYLDNLIQRMLPKLRFHLDGKPIELKVLQKQVAGLRGEIGLTGSPFDTFFDLEADVALGPGHHELVYYEGTYEGDVSQQILHVVTDHASDLADFELEQKTQGPPPIEEYGAVTLQGRDVTVKFQFSPGALERDKAEALIEPCMAGLQDTVDQLATNVARSTEKDLAALPVGPALLGVGQRSVVTSGVSGFNISAPTAGNRETASRGGSSGAPRGGTASEQLRSPDNDELKKMDVKLREPFTILAIFVFLAWGAAHATMPGHGKTMVAAYLLGTKGRLWDAVRLGLIVTFTHTFTLYTFGLGLVVLTSRLTLSKDVLYQKSTFLITLISGIGLWLFGLTLAWRRSAKAKKPAVDHDHDHDHEHGHDHGHAHAHAHAPVALPEKLEAPRTGRKLGLVAAAPVEVAAPGPAHSHDGHTHSHDGHSHSHGEHSHGDMSEDEHAAFHAKEATTEITSFGDLLKLGIAGGIIPCPAGVLLIVGSIGTQIPPLKTFLYLNAFSVGLGSVIIGIATTMVFSRKFLDKALSGNRKRVLDLLPVVSAVLVSFIGLGIAYGAFDPNYTKAKERLSTLLSQAPVTKSR